MGYNEQTSARVATLASKILQIQNVSEITPDRLKELRSIAASCLTQAPDKINPVPTGLFAASNPRLSYLATLGKQQHPIKLADAAAALEAFKKKS